MPKKNPLNLNALQLKTLTLFQHLAGHVPLSFSTDQGIPIGVPQPHGDHFHLDDAVVSTRDATGLGNRAVWLALERKGLITGSEFPNHTTVTSEGLGYETGLAEQILHRADH